MPSLLTVQWTEDAADDLDEIVTYIAADNPGAAASVRERLFQAVEYLSAYPHTGHAVDRADVLMWPLGRYPYLIFYTVVGDELHVLHIRHGARRHPGFQEEAVAYAF